MAELVGLASSIATLAAAGFHVARKISTVADDLGTASAQIKSIAVDTKAVAIILRDIEAKLMSGNDSSRKLNDDTRDVLAEVLELCRHEIEDLDRNLAPLRADGRRPDTADLKQKAKWLFDKPKIATRQASLDSLKLTLSLLLHNVQLFDGGRSHEPNVHYCAPAADHFKTKDAVVLVSQVNDEQPPPSYEAIIECEEGKTAHNSEQALDTALKTIVQPESPESDGSSWNLSMIPDQPPSDLPLKLIEVQEKVRCLEVKKKERRDARRAEKAMKWEAWKERKQAKRAARVAWKEERRTVRA